MFIPKGSNKHKERPRPKSFSGEVLLCTLRLGVVGEDWLLAVADRLAEYDDHRLLQAECLDDLLLIPATTRATTQARAGAIEIDILRSTSGMVACIEGLFFRGAADCFHIRDKDQHQRRDFVERLFPAELPEIPFFHQLQRVLPAVVEIDSVCGENINALILLIAGGGDCKIIFKNSQIISVFLLQK